MVREDAPRGGGTALDRRPLDWRAIETALRGRTIGRRIVYHASTGSTNDDAKALAAAGEPEGTVVLADEQTAGRGRAGKAPWLTPARTSVALSVILRPDFAAERLPYLGMAAGIAASHGVMEVARWVACGLKWPNDVMVGERKLGGILVESALTPGGVGYGVIGIGLNVNVPASAMLLGPGSHIPATTVLEETGVRVSREALVTAVLERLEWEYGCLCGGAYQAVLREYRARLGTLGRTVRVTASDGETEGTAVDVAESGALVLRLPNGSRREFSYGEVSVRPTGADRSALRSGE